MKTIHYITEEDRIPCLFDFCPPGCQAGSHISDLQGIISAYDDFMRLDRKSTRLNSSHSQQSRMPSSA